MQDGLNLNDSRFDWNNEASFDQRECEFVYHWCKTNKIDSAIEFGPGNSTTALLLAGVPNIYPYEHDAGFRDKMTARFSESVSLRSYIPQSMPLIVSSHAEADMAIIDGYSGFPIPRLNQAIYCLTRVKYLFLHDSIRDDLTFRTLLAIGMSVASSCDSKRGLMVLKAN